MELTHIGARMMLQVALEEEIKAFLGRDYYERREDQKGSRSESKPRSIKIGCGDIHIRMPQARGADTPFHSKLLPPYLTQIKEIQDTILDGIRLGVRGHTREKEAILIAWGFLEDGICKGSVIEDDENR